MPAPIVPRPTTPIVVKSRVGRSESAGWVVLLVMGRILPRGPRRPPRGGSQAEHSAPSPDRDRSDAGTSPSTPILGPGFRTEVGDARLAWDGARRRCSHR